MSRITIDRLIREVRPYFGQTILKRGWDYYRNDVVDEFEFVDDMNIRAIVFGSDYYEIELNLKQFSRSYCDCPYDGYCKHMAAVLFELCRQLEEDPKQFLSPDYSRVGRHSHTGREAASGYAEAAASSTGMPAKVKNSPESAKTPGPHPSDDPLKWHHLFEKKCEKLSYYGMHSFQTLSQEILSKLLPPAAQWPAMQRLYYELHVALFTLKKIDELARGVFQIYYNSYYSAEHFSQLSHDSLKTIRSVMSRLLALSMLDTEPDKLEGTIEYLSLYAFPAQTSYVKWHEAYALFWSAVPMQSKWVKQEKRRLDDRLHKKGQDVKQLELIVLARMFFLLREEDDSAAMRLAGNYLSRVEPGPFLPYLQSFAERKQWTRLTNWLTWLEPAVIQTGRHAEAYLQFWEQAAGQLPELEQEWKRAVVSLLPRSYSYYSGHLLERGNYREWIDLNILCGVLPLQIGKMEYKQVESADLRYLLPLYHHAVEHLIMEKKRDSYKMAVRHLKKMDVLYRKLKQQERWTQYMAGLRKRYSRLRAFQEELQKGKCSG